MDNQNGFGAIEIFIFICVVGMAGALYYKFSPKPVVVSEEKKENVRLRELLKDYKDRFETIDAELVRLNTKTDNQSVAVEKADKELRDTVKYHTQLLSSVEVDQGKLETRMASFEKSISYKIPKIIDVKIEQLAKPLEVKITSNLQKTKSRSIERWKRRSYGWEKDIVTRTVPYTSSKKEMTPDQKKKLKDSINETRTAMTKAGL